MLFGDEVEILDEDRKYPESYAVPMNRHISIKEIWIPAHLLLNRQKALDSDRQRPNLYHTLSKPEVESFLTYEDTEVKKKYIKLHSFGYNSPPEFKDKTFHSGYHKNEKSTSLDSVRVEKENKVDNLRERYSDTFNSETQLCEVEANCHDNTDSTNSLKIVNKTQSDDFISNCSLEASGELPNDYQQRMLQDSSKSGVQSNETGIGSVDDNQKKSDLLYAANQSLVDNLHEHCLDALGIKTQLCNAEANSSDMADSTNLEIVDTEKISGDSTTSSSFEVLENLPVPYQKRVVPELPTKQKRQKEKKKKNAVNKAIQLGDFLESPNVDGYVPPKRDLFYEGLVLQGKCPPIDFPYYSNPQRDIYEFPKRDSPPPQDIYEFPKRDSPPPQDSCAGSLIEEHVANENLLSDDDVEDGALTTLVLENVPFGTSKDTIASLVVDYGKLKGMSLVPNGKFSTAYVRLILEHEVEWIIDCLDGTKPFGASCETLKCYQQ